MRKRLLLMLLTVIGFVAALGGLRLAEIRRLPSRPTTAPDRDAVNEYAILYGQGVKALREATADLERQALELREMQTYFEVLRAARIMWNPPENMIQGKAHDISTRVAYIGEDAALDAGIPSSPAKRIHVERVSRVVDVKLSGVPSDAFHVTALRSPEQLLGAGRPSDWLWSVKPVRAGEFELVLTLTLVLTDPNAKDRRRDVSLAPRRVRVKVSALYAAEGFVREHFAIVMTLVAAPLVASGLAWMRLRRMKRRRAGF